MLGNFVYANTRHITTRKQHMFKAEIEGTVLKTPQLIFTLKGQPASEAVLKIVQEEMKTDWPIDVEVFENVEAIHTTFQNGHRPERSIVLFDGYRSGHFEHTCHGRMNGTKIPDWAQGAQWGVHISEHLIRDENALRSRTNNCAEQLRADFCTRFDICVHELHIFPWGHARRGETLPNRPRLKEEIRTILHNLEQGPDMAGEVFEALRGRLPEGQKISWIRVPDRPAQVNRAMMDQCLDALKTFEQVCTELVQSDPDIAQTLLRGVDLDPNHPELRSAYLFPKSDNLALTHWSVRRPDMHLCDKKFVASENDEMPGGFTDCFHIDRSYGINFDAWRETFDWLCSKGPLLFVVSHQWSKGYILSMQWMAEQMRAMGYPAYCITSTPEDLDRLIIGGNVRLDVDNPEGPGGTLIRIGTIWRQFPIFETRGKLAELFMASQHGYVRMVPEFAHFGNKTWFAVFREKQYYFREHLTSNQFQTLRMLIPPSAFIAPNEPIDVGIAQIGLTSFQDLLDLSENERKRLVLKITGANDLAARSLGVFMGHAHKQSDWQAWLNERRSKNEAFIVQQRFETSVEHLAVYNTSTRQAEPFACRVLLRPWVVGDKLVTSHTACTPHWTTKVHGMVDMAVQPIVFV